MAPALVVVAALLLSLLATASAEKSIAVTCGSVFKLQHVQMKVRLHSHEVAYSRGSQQQSVTGFPTGENGQSYWVLRGPVDAECTPGDTIKKGQKVRLLHQATRKWLHSHKFYSPLTNQQEVSAFGSDTVSDGGDVWTVEWDSKEKLWRQDTKVRFKHVDTGAVMITHDAKFGDPIAGHTEVCALAQGGAGHKAAEWKAAEGVYLPVAVAEEAAAAVGGAAANSEL